MWEVNGIKGEGATPPHVAGQYSGLLIIMGGAECVWADLQGIARLFGKEFGPKWEDDVIPGADYMATNDIGAYWHGRLTHWVTLHPRYMGGWREFRNGHNYGGGIGVEVHSMQSNKAVDNVWGITNVGGSSGLFGCKVALALGYQKIILAGTPIDNSKHFFDAPWYSGVPLGGGPEAIVWQQAKREEFKNRVKSMSGRTKEWLGPPTIEWLREEIRNG
jgi:hypothetical protein